MRIYRYLIPGLFLFAGFLLFAQDAEGDKLKPHYHEVNAYVEENESCLKCHGEVKYTLEDTLYGRTVTQAMWSNLILDRDAYYSGVHRSFMCTDCHSSEFEEFPHSLDVRMEENFGCIDCHGYDETFADYHFEEIEVEFTESIHNMEGFSCWKCHDPHAYKPNMRGTENIKEAIQLNNSVCLDCHGNFDNFMLFTDKEEINVVESHNWLPNQVAHIRSVRCIECHTEVNDSILIAHKILPKTEAVKRCTECHSRDSRLMHSLYKFQSKENRRGGFMNGVIINDTYVIGANQNIFLNRLSIAIFALAFLVIVFHTILRIIKLRN
ncbi:MAG: cytochrome c3 family protein [Bacteroidales bacterium]|nr:cytochrome c3 family protein [Bacteroidales bacterium]